MKAPKAEKTMAKIPLLVGTGKVGSVMATATARHAETEGAAKGQVSASESRMHG